MAGEKIKLFELEIDLQSAIKDTKAYAEEVALLKSQAEKAKKEQGELSEEYIGYSAALKSAQNDLRTQKKVTQDVISANVANTGSIEQQRKQLAVVSVQWAKLTKDERLNSETGKKLTAQKTQLTNALKKEERATGDARRNVGNYTKSMDGAIGATSQLSPAVGQAANAMRGLGKAFTVALGPIGLVLAAIALVVAGLKAFFTASEEGQDAWDSFAASAGVALDNVTDRLSDLTESILEDPGKALDEFLDFIKNSFGKQLEGTIELLGSSFRVLFANINLGYQKLKGQVTDNTEGIKDAQKSVVEANQAVADSFAKIGEGATNALKPVVDFYEETSKEIEESNKLLAQQAGLNRQIRNSIVANARDAARVAEIRAGVADKENKDAQERLDLLNEAIELEEKILQRNLSIAQQKLFIKATQNSLSKSTREDLDEEARLRADVFNVRKANFEKLRRLQQELTSAQREIGAEEKKIRDQEQKDFEAQLLTDAKQAAQQLKDALDIDKQVQAAKQEQRAQAQQQKLIEFEAELAANQDNAFRVLELERQSLEAQKVQEIAFAESIGADTANIEKKFANASIAIDKAKQDAKLSLAQDFAGNVATIFGEQTAVGKAAAVAQATINTYTAATGAYSALAPVPIVGPALGAIAAAAAIVAGLANVKKILSVKSGLPGDSGGGASVPSGGAPAPAAQSLDPGINQGIVSRETIQQGAETQEPTVAVVTDQVTQSQAVQSSNSNVAIA